MNDIEFIETYWFLAEAKFGTGIEATKKLCELLGVYCKENGDFTVKLTRKLRRQIRAIAGPHGKTIIKVIEVRKHD